jgi:hypothetical protein
VRLTWVSAFKEIERSSNHLGSSRVRTLAACLAIYERPIAFQGRRDFCDLRSIRRCTAQNQGPDYLLGTLTGSTEHVSLTAAARHSLGGLAASGRRYAVASGFFGLIECLISAFNGAVGRIPGR